MDAQESEQVFRYWVEIRDRRDGSVRTLPLSAFVRVHLVDGKAAERRPDEQVLQVEDELGVIEASDLDGLAAQLRARYPDDTYDRCLRRERDPVAERNRAEARSALIELVARAVHDSVVNGEMAFSREAEDRGSG